MQQRCQRLRQERDDQGTHQTRHCTGGHHEGGKNGFKTAEMVKKDLPCGGHRSELVVFVSFACAAAPRSLHDTLLLGLQLTEGRGQHSLHYPK